MVQEYNIDGLRIDGEHFKFKYSQQNSVFDHIGAFMTA